jgi:hypothetical protein
MMSIPNPSAKPWMARIIKNGRSVGSQVVGEPGVEFLFVCKAVNREVDKKMKVSNQKKGENF